ncbi:hypothetical protein [Myxococcus sp. CA040A]|uniref:hypothetical protein n=1 Tax=Myxococcus sp. CA040A TaxID=2741738 RepID=UPI00157B483E|nr:hypothetical protein [Myxococcus sp. CA040A]NTX08007.1 hypothetical protein [Myxococcus sp. CA040A]
MPETPRHRFKDQPDAMKLLHLRRTQEWVGRVAANAESGYRTARTFAWVHHNKEWLLSGDYLRAPPALPREATGTDTSLLTLVLAPQASLLAHGQEVLAAYHRLVQAGQQLLASVHRFYEQHPWAKEHTRLWQSEQRLFCAFTMLAVEAEDMGPKISPQEMEALALVVGIWLPGDEFEQDPKSNEQRQAAWKAMMRDVDESGVLPLLRKIAAEHRPLEQATGTAPAAAVPQAVSMPSPAAPLSEQPVTTSPESSATVPPAQPTMISAEQSEEDGGG